MPYQDRWVRGRTVTRGERECEDRYALIKAIADDYTRPFTVLDIGANLGYFGCRLADECDAVSIMVDARRDLVVACTENAIPTTIALTKRLSVEDLRQLAASEHIDLVLALNVLHHFDDWKGALDATLRLGDQVIIETPSPDDSRACGKRAHVPLYEAVMAAGDVIGTAPSHVTAGARRPLVHVQREKSALTQGYAYRAKLGGNVNVRQHIIESTSSQKSILYASGEEREWAPGMNLWNWCQLGGSYPTRDTVVEAVTSAVETVEHGDLRPWNFILQGERVVPIDTSHRQTHCDAVALEETLAWIRNPEQAFQGAR